MSPSEGTIAHGGADQERDDRGRFGSGGGGTGGGLPRADTHAQTEGGGRFEKGTAKEGQVTWAHTKAKEQGKSVYMEPNLKHDPANPKAGDGGPFKLSFKPPKGERHEVKPDGSMVYHPAPAKAPRAPRGAPKGAVVHSRAVCARAIETSADGKAPHAVRLWRAGWNETDRGALNFTPRSAEMVMSAFAARGNPLVFDYEHESTIPIDKRGGCPMRGVASADRATLEVRKDGAGQPELWASGIGWTAEAQRQIEARERTQVSPISRYDLETKEITAIENVALCREGATHHGTLLASREGRTGSVDDIIQKIMEALQMGDFESAETLVQQAEAMAEGGDMGAVKMARAAMAGMKAAAPPPPPPAEEKPKPAPAAMAASRAIGQGADVLALSRELDQSRRETAAARTESAKALHEAKVGRVEGIIAASRDCFDAVDERSFLRRADPEAAREHVASVTRKRAEGTLAASRPAGAPPVNPPKDANAGKDETHGLSVVEIQAATMNKVDLPTYAASKARINGQATTRRGS